MGEAMSEAEAIAAGETVLGREVTFELTQRRTNKVRPANGDTVLQAKIREAKNGPEAELSANQLEMQLVVKEGGTVIPERQERGGGWTDARRSGQDRLLRSRPILRCLGVKIDLITQDSASDEFVLYLVEDGPWPAVDANWQSGSKAHSRQSAFQRWINRNRRSFGEQVS